MFEFFAVVVVNMIVSYAIHALTAEKPKDATAGKLDVPMIDEGATIPVLFGEILIKEPGLVWYGDDSTVPIRAEGGKKG
jgi:hypothetical protein